MDYRCILAQKYLVDIQDCTSNLGLMVGRNSSSLHGKTLYTRFGDMSGVGRPPSVPCTISVAITST